METTQNPPSEFDYAAAAADIVRYVRQQWPDAGTWRQAEALIVAVYAVGGSLNGAAVLAGSLPTLPNALGNRRAAFGASVLTDGLAGKRAE